MSRVIRSILAALVCTGIYYVFGQPGSEVSTAPKEALSIPETSSIK